ncbi:hypothetical protein PLESTM_002079000 [Pleodorina starrii]|nr:hypothetical protein PLESTM_002079000 [Pleodorina starrii]
MSLRGVLGSPHAGASAPLPLTSPGTGARRTSRRLQQQELLWGATPAPDAAWQQQQQLNAQLLTAPAPPPPPPKPLAQQEQQQQSRHSAGAPAGDAAAGECGGSDGSGQVGPADLLAQQDAALMLRGGRHRNRQPVVSPLQPQQPPGAAVATAAGALLPSQQQQGDAGPLDAAASEVRGLRGRDGADLAGGGDSGGGVKADGPDVREAQRRRRPGRKPPADSAGGARLQPGGATAATAVPGNDDAAEGAGDGGGGGSASTVSPRGNHPPAPAPPPHVVLRLRRHGPDTRAPRSIRLPLPQRPKPWPVKLLLEAKQREKQQQQQMEQQQQEMELQQQQRQQQQETDQQQQMDRQQQWLEQQVEPQQPSPGQGRGVRVEERGQLQGWLGPELEEGGEEGGSQRGLAAAGPTRQAEGQGRGGEMDRQRQPEGLGSGLGQAAGAFPGQPTLEPASEGAQRRQDLQRRRPRGAREEGQQRPERQAAAEPQDGKTMARVRSQTQQPPEAPTQQQHRQQQGGTAAAKGPPSQRGRAGQPGDEAPDPQRPPHQSHQSHKPLAGASAPASAAPGSAAATQWRRSPPRPPVTRWADTDSQAVGVTEAEAVAAHPDGTLWAYRRRDVGPLAARLLHHLKQQPQQQGQQQGQQRQKCGDGSGAHSDIGKGSPGDNIRSGGDIIANGDGGGGGGACHVLVAGSYQAYSLLRSLSYVQGALRLASYNLQSYAGAGAPEPDGSVGAAAAPPAVGFTASGVSVQDLRSYYEQTVRHGAGPRPELGPPPPPPRTSPQGGSSSPGAAPSRPHGDASSSSSGGGGGTSSAGKLPLSSPPRLPRPLPTLKGWPEDEVQLSPRALVSVFLVPPPPPPPLDLLYGAAGGGGGGHAAGDDDTPPIAVTARADEATLIRLLTTRLRRHGSAHMRALGREAASRALAVLYGACRALSYSGLTALAFPHMTALGPQPRGELGPLAAPLAAAAAAGRRRARSAALGPPSPPSPSPSSAAAAAAVASLDPVLLDKAPQLVLRVVLCEWDAEGRPVAAVVPERTGLDPPAHTTTPALVAPVADSDSGADSDFGSGSPSPPTDAESPPQAALAAPPASSSGGGAAAAAAASRPRPQPPVRLRVPAAAAAAGGRGEAQRRVVVLGPDGGGPDTRGAAAVVAGSLAEGRRVAVAARGLGALLRLPVVVFRAQGRMGKVVDAEVGWRREGRQTRKALVFSVFWLPLSALQHHLHSLPGPPPEPIITRSANRRLLPSRADHYDYDYEDENNDEDDEDGDDDDEEEDGGAGDQGGGGDGGGGEKVEEEDQRHVQAAAAAAAAQLARYGTATLEGSSPGRRVTALLAAAGLSAGLRSAAGLTVLVRVPPPPAGVQLRQQGGQRKEQQQQQQEEGRGQQQQRKAVDGAHGKPSPAWRPPPPRRYQLLLARMDPRVGRLQLLRPEDLSELRRAEATRAAQE